MPSFQQFGGLVSRHHSAVGAAATRTLSVLPEQRDHSLAFEALKEIGHGASSVCLAGKPPSAGSLLPICSRPLAWHGPSVGEHLAATSPFFRGVSDRTHV